ncbi:MAG: gluconokinase [Corynebacterium glucuronolyticum]|nr:gluconokinase [Mycobacteriaceae bacterium]MDY5835253.1 gluconokinase [Corynebacterium glucuronolyticum]
MADTPKIPTMSIKLKDSTAPYVLAMDVGSTASRGGLYDATGCPVKGSKQRIAHEFTTGHDGRSTIDADQVANECREIVTAIVAFAEDKGLRISGVCFDSFASSFLLVDKQKRALTPCATYADSRCAAYVAELKQKTDVGAYHQRTGVRVHTSYHPARFLWVQDQFPDLWEKTWRVMTIGEYVYMKLAGIEGLATSTGAWSGIVSAHTGELDTEILSACNVPASLISPLHLPTEPAFPTALDWPALDSIPWFHGIPDGWPSNVGPGATDESTIAVAAATSGAMRVLLPEAPANLPDGLWCYRVAKNQVILGGALNDVGRAISWLERTVAPLPHEDIENALAGAPSTYAPEVLPFFSGERATGWASGATASLIGVTDDTTPLDLWRGIIEGIAISYGRIYEQLDDAGAQPERVIASGRVTTDHPAWLHVLADTLRCNVVPLAMKRATLRGTALIALDIIAPGISRAEPPFGEEITPVEKHQDYYRSLRENFDIYYDALINQPRTE